MNFEEKKLFLEKAIALAESWLNESLENASASVKKNQNRWGRLVCNNHSKNVLVALFDQTFRSENALRSVDRFIHLLRQKGIPETFSVPEKCLLVLFNRFGKIIPPLSLKLLKKNILKNVSHVVLDDNSKFLANHIRKRQREKVRMNLNFLGELVLGEKEAIQRLNSYLKALENPDIDYISVKISSICSLLRPLAHKRALGILKDRLFALYKKAQSFPRRNGEAKFVNLDMEEYKDLDLTLSVFIEVLSEERFKNLRAGIVLQAYLPDASACYEKLLRFAHRRIEKGGAPLKLRLVKGANLQQELVESAIHGWSSPIYDSKIQSDAHFKKILQKAVIPKNARVLNLGVASHNLFDLAYASVLVEFYQSNEFVSFEMLEGIGEGNRKVVQSGSKEFILYAPVAGETDFLNAVTYLIRRLDENTATENYLRHAFNMKPKSLEWEYLKQQFLDSAQLAENLETKPQRTQNRSAEILETKNYWRTKCFENEPETDFHLSSNQAWAERICRDWKEKFLQGPIEIPVVIGNEEFTKEDYQDFYDPNNKKKIHTYHVSLSCQEDIKRATQIAEQDPDGWSRKSRQERFKIMEQLAIKFRERRRDLIGIMAIVTGKIFPESDDEVTEAIDFAEYYPYSLQRLHEQTKFTEKPKGTVLVITPWNFPVAIPAGGMIAALTTGNRVLFKPAPETMPVAWELVRCFWDAGVPRNALQIINCREGEDLNGLTRSPIVRHIIFTGSTETVEKIMMARPDIPVSAETGGKNCMVVSAMADWDQAVKNAVNSAFSNTGQKCSAASLLILEKELFESKKFKDKLKDMTESLLTGSALDLENDVGPLICPPKGKLKTATEQLESGESWLVKPRSIPGNPRLVSPGIKWGVKKSSFCYREELFGPLLSVMKAKNFEDALSLVNTEYGLTSGLESLDEREIQCWKAQALAGNLYVNRGVTGAIVRRQPFGGFLNSKSAYGIGLKAGGPNYVLQLIEPVEITPSKQKPEKIPKILSGKDFSSVSEIVFNYCRWAEIHFNQNFEESRVLGQDNIFRYRKGQKPFLYRIGKTTAMENALSVFVAAFLAGSSLTVSASPDLPRLKFLNIAEELFTVKIETEEEALENAKNICFIRLTEVEAVSEVFRKNCAEIGLSFVDHIPYPEGRFELIYYFQEQSISENYHRYGNLGFREKS